MIDRQRLEEQMPGAADNALIVRPIEVFATLWPQVVEQAQERALSVAVIGAGAAGLELLFAAEQCLRTRGAAGARFTLITGGVEPAASYPAGLQARVLRRLKRLNITVLRDTCVGLAPGVVKLGIGSELACDVPLLAIGAHAPAWLQGSGLALSESGHVLVNEFQQSTSHPEVFAAGDVCARTDRPHPRNGVYAVRAGPPLAANLLAAHEDQPLKPHHPPANTLNLLSCGAGHAIASYGPLHAEGGWAWRWKDRIDRAFMARYTLPAADPEAGDGARAVPAGPAHHRQHWRWHRHARRPHETLQLHRGSGPAALCGQEKREKPDRDDSDDGRMLKYSPVREHQPCSFAHS